MTDADAPGDGSPAGVDCAVCGDAVETDEWHPVATEADPEETRIVPFCTEDCREQWLAEHPGLSAGEQ